MEGESMPMDIDSIPDDFEELFKDIKVPEKNIYISNEDKAVELIAELITNENSSISVQNKIEEKINQLFYSLSNLSLEHKMYFYERFMEICSKMSEVQKIKKIQHKVVLSFGGKVSAGKSKFINSISGIGSKLPVDQKTTTAIPTYIIKSRQDAIYANSIGGNSSKVSSEALNAMAHEFDNVYGFGFSAFVDSIIIESSDYILPEEIALLDTPGYTKYDQDSDSKRVLSDRQKAFKQLSISDYLIWLIDIDSGAITEDDIQFIESLPIKTPVLIIFTKADLKPDQEIKQIIEQAEQSLSRTNIHYFGVSAYSSNLKKEFGGNKIQEFFDFARESNVRNNDVLEEFGKIAKDMRQEIENKTSQIKKEAQEIFHYIAKSNQFMNIQSLAQLWGKTNQEGFKAGNLLQLYDNKIQIIQNEIQKYCK